MIIGGSDRVSRNVGAQPPVAAVYPCSLPNGCLWWKFSMHEYLFLWSVGCVGYVNSFILVVSIVNSWYIRSPFTMKLQSVCPDLYRLLSTNKLCTVLSDSLWLQCVCMRIEFYSVYKHCAVTAMPALWGNSVLLSSRVSINARILKCDPLHNASNWRWVFRFRKCRK